ETPASTRLSRCPAACADCCLTQTRPYRGSSGSAPSRSSALGVGGEPDSPRDCTQPSTAPGLVALLASFLLVPRVIQYARTHSGGTRAQVTAAFYQHPLRLDRVSAALGALGGADGGRISRRHHPRPWHLPAPLRHHGKTWAASAAGKRSAQRALRGAQCRPAGIRGRVSRVLLR